jgi:RNA polymerase sigma factor (sigma-70 family)
MAKAALSTVLQQVRQLVETSSLAETSDAALLERFVREGDQASFAVLLQRHGAMVLAVCRGLIRHEQDAEDVFQATFLLLARKAGSVRKRESVGSWLHGVARRLALKARAQGARRQSRERRAATMHQAPSEPGAAWQEVKAALDEALAHLPEKYRAALILCYLEGKSHEEAARQLGCPLTTLRSRVARGRSLVHKRLTSRGLALSLAGWGSLVVLSGTPAAPPAALLQRTWQAACALGRGETLTAAVSGPVAALVEEGAKMMLLARMKIATALMVTLSLLASGTCLAMQRVLAGKPDRDQAPAAAAAVPPADKGTAEAPRLDRYGDPLPAGARLRLGTLRFRLGNGIYALALAPDGKTAVSVGGHSKTQFWDVPTGKEARCIEGWKQGGGGRAVAYSPDGRLIATVQDHVGLHLWEAATGKHLAQLGLTMTFTRCLGFSPDSTVLAAGGALNKYGRSEETSSDSVLGLWRWDGAKLQPLWEAKPDHGAPIGPRSEGIDSLAFSSDGKHLATGGLNNGLIRIWDVARGKEIHKAKASGTQVGALAYAPTGKGLASGSDDGVVVRWDLATKAKQWLAKQPGEVRALAFTPDGTTLAVGGGPEYGRSRGKKNEPFFVLLDATSGKERRPLPIQQDSRVVSAAFSRDGKVLVAGLGGALGVWDGVTGNERSHFQGHQHWIASAAISQDGRAAVTAGGDGALILWDLTRGTERQRFRGHQADIRAAAFVPGGKLLASAGTDQTVRVCDLATAREVKRFEGSANGLIYSLVISPDGKILAAGDYSDGSIHIWNRMTGAKLHTLKIGNELGLGVMCLAFSADGQRLAAGETALNAMRASPEVETRKARIVLWDAATGKKLVEFSAHAYAVDSLAFSPDGTLLASTGWSDKAIGLWDVASGHRLAELPCGSGGVVAFSPDGKTVAWGNSPEGIWLLELASQEPRRKLPGHAAAIHSLAFSPDGKTLISASMDTTALVWDVSGLANGTAVPLSPAQLRSHWTALANSDAAQAGRSIWSLTADPERAVPFIEERLRELPRVDPQRIPRLIADLDSASFKTRQDAEKKLEALGRLAVHALREALAGKVALESRRRINNVLDKREKPIAAPETLQVLRALEVLEHAGSAEARRALENFTRQASESYFRQEAQAAAERLATRGPRQPD